MNWETRALGIVLAGGSLTLGACSSSSDNIPCGNASSDPCICGRPQADPFTAQQCSVLTACRDAGGMYSPGQEAPDGAVVEPPSCMLDTGDTGTSDTGMFYTGDTGTSDTGTSDTGTSDTATGDTGMDDASDATTSDATTIDAGDAGPG
jgi:hypothetical protein